MLYNFTCNLSFTDIQTRNALVGWLMTNIPSESLTNSFSFNSTNEGYHIITCTLDLKQEALRDTIYDYVCEYVTQNAISVVSREISRHVSMEDEGQSCYGQEIFGGDVSE